MCATFFEKIGAAIALPLRGIQEQSNIMTCIEPEQKIIQHVDVLRLTWIDTNNKTETIFKPPIVISGAWHWNPASPLWLKNTNYIIRQLTGMSPLDSRLIFHRQSTDIPPTIDTPRIGRVLTGILAMYWPVYRVTCRSNVRQYTGRHIVRVSTDISIDIFFFLFLIIKKITIM